MDRESLSQLESPSPIALAGLAEFLLQKTWSIRLLSPFVSPLKFNGRRALLEKEISLRIIKNRKRRRDTSEENTVEIDVQLFWGLVGTGSTNSSNANSQQCSSEGSDERERLHASKRRKLDGEIERQKHLVIDVSIDGVSSQVVCCYPKLENNSEKEDEISKGFDFLLTRGSKSCIESCISWLETATRCKISESVFSPSVVDLIQATTFWTTEHWHLTKMGLTQHGESDDNNSSYTTTTKPLTLTYQVPSGPAGEAGLESISLTVPPVSLLRLCNDLLSARQLKSEMSEQSGEKRKDDTVTNPSSEYFGDIPIVRALQCFLRENFRIHIEKFALIRASSSAGVLGCDGRCKPLCATLLRVVLSEIRLMILKRR